MPIYEYECANCGKRLEAMQSVGDSPLTDCPECQQSALRKLLSAPAFQFKGSGWYVTDYANRGKKKEGKEPKKEESKVSADDKGGSEKSKGDAGSSKSATGSS